MTSDTSGLREECRIAGQHQHRHEWDGPHLLCAALSQGAAHEERGLDVERLTVVLWGMDFAKPDASKLAERIASDYNGLTALAATPAPPTEEPIPDLLAMTAWPGYERHQHADGSWCQRKAA